MKIRMGDNEIITNCKIVKSVWTQVAKEQETKQKGCQLIMVSYTP